MATDDKAQGDLKDAKAKKNEPGFVYNDEGAEIANPGLRHDPLVGDDKPIGWRQFGDRVQHDDAPDAKAWNTPAVNPADGPDLTPAAVHKAPKAETPAKK